MYNLYHCHLCIHHHPSYAYEIIWFMIYMSFMCICVLCSFVEYLAFRILKEHDLWSRSHASPRWYGRLDVYRYFMLFLPIHCISLPCPVISCYVTCVTIYTVLMLLIGLSWLRLASVGSTLSAATSAATSSLLRQLRQRSAGQSRATTTADTLGITVAMSAMSAMS